MKKIILLLVFPFSFVSFCQTQNLTATVLTNKSLAADTFIGYDGLENLHFVKNDILFKQSTTELWQYRNISLGKITRVDLQNPLNIVLFYENFNTVVLLDNQLNETQKINFSENNFPINATATGIATQNRLWIYNNLTQEIGLFDYLKNTFQSITPSFQGTFMHYETDFNTFYWIDEKNDLYSCTAFGKITTMGKLPVFDQFQVISSKAVLYKNNTNLFYYTLNDNKSTLIDFDKKTFMKFQYRDQILSIFTTEGITNFKIILP
ncbi:hypothetical protein [Flavobacterium sp.]|uniref:hypothetical protein n=1 Tax=Flavobacterium sp. TaxID=239 RepID=UPI00286CBDFE|nr:hypothetical protein [Flavobacterium sp.]